MSNRHFPTFNGLLTMGQYKVLTTTHTSRTRTAEAMHQRGLIEITSRKQVHGRGPVITYRVTDYGRRILEDAT